MDDEIMDEHVQERTVDGELIITVTTPEHEYEIFEDEWTGDWCIHSETDPRALQKWVRNRGGAIQFALERGDVIQKGEYETAPDRTSA